MVSGLLMMRLLVSMVISFGEESARLGYMVIQIKVILHRNDTPVSRFGEYIICSRPFHKVSRQDLWHVDIDPAVILSQPSRREQKTASQVSTSLLF